MNSSEIFNDTDFVGHLQTASNYHILITSVIVTAKGYSRFQTNKQTVMRVLTSPLVVLKNYIF